ncbi:MAG: arginine--tRNA ligase, partial [Chitinophagaceae bacterium]
MSLVTAIKQAVAKTLTSLYQIELAPEAILVNETKPEFEGNYTVVLFSFVKQLKANPETLGNQIGSYCVQEFGGLFNKYNVIKGFLNFTITETYWLNFLQAHAFQEKYGFAAPTHKKVMVEYSSPNTNKPLHLGHLRNNFLGWSIAEIAQSNGNVVIKTCIVND